jgi:fructan beta-fructosidase
MKLLLFFLLVCSGALAQTPTPQWRPVYHFTPEAFWTNDPNGPIYLHGEWLVYNQQNPFENKWGHMSWGHAKSRDLLHWQHLPVAIPEKIDPARGDTTWIFSGSAVWDEHNSSGFCRDSGCLVAIYTAHQPNLKKESQYIAYSNDGGMSFTNYPGNPVIDLNKRDFRDPNVFWHAASKQWVMAVALPSEHKVRFYGSSNLRDWQLLSEFGPEGYTGAHWECPSLVELPVSGEPGVTKWVLMNSAAGGVRGVFMQYFVGDFDGKVFHNDNPPDTVLTVDYGDCFYAAIPFNDAPFDAKILVGWMIPGVQHTYPWTGQFSIPRDLLLRKTAAGYRLVQEPASVVARSFAALPAGARRSVAGLVLNHREVEIDSLYGLRGNAWMLDAELEVGVSAVAGFRIGQGRDAVGRVVSETVIGYDAAAGQVFVDRSRSGAAKLRPGSERQTIDLGGASGGGAGGGTRVRLQVLMDKGSLEVFVNGGEKVLTTYVYPEEGGTGCSAFATGGKAVIKTMRIWDLSKL